MGGKLAILNFGGMGVFADLGVFAGVYGIISSLMGMTMGRVGNNLSTIAATTIAL